MDKSEWKKGHRGGSAIYCLGGVGALVYFLQQATTLWEGVIGILKSMVWPALVVYKLLGFLQI